MKRARPIPTGARNVVLDFSAARRKIVNINIAVKNISKNIPRTGDMPGARRVVTYNGPGKIAWIIAAAEMAPRHWDIDKRTARVGVITPTRARPSETAGLKSPPLIRKKTQALTVRLKPKERAINCREEVLGA